MGVSSSTPYYWQSSCWTPRLSAQRWLPCSWNTARMLRARNRSEQEHFPPAWLRVQARRQERLSIKGQMGNVSSFARHTVSVTTTQFCCCNAKGTWGWLVFSKKNLLTDSKIWVFMCHANFMCHEIIFLFWFAFNYLYMQNHMKAHGISDLAHGSLATLSWLGDVFMGLLVYVYQILWLKFFKNIKK